MSDRFPPDSGDSPQLLSQLTERPFQDRLSEKQRAKESVETTNNRLKDIEIKVDPLDFHN